MAKTSISILSKFGIFKEIDVYFKKQLYDKCERLQLDWLRSTLFLPCHPSYNLKILEFWDAQNDFDWVNRNNCFNILIFLSIPGLLDLGRARNGQKDEDVETII